MRRRQLQQLQANQFLASLLMPAGVHQAIETDVMGVIIQVIVP